MARMLTRTFTAIGIAALGFVLTGCVSSDQYKALKLDRDNLAEQLAKSQRDSDAKNAEASAYKSQLDQLASNGNTSTALVSNLQQQNANLQAQLDEANRRIEKALNDAANRPAGNALPVVLTNELTQFAQANPDLVDFNAAQGIVKFKSDVTFAPGDANLTPQAREVIHRFSAILNSPNASQYELMVAGHTDDTPVHNPATIAAGNKDNWYLSCHRAISVGDELIASRVSPNRLAMVGYADQRPIESNSSASGQAANRRVEVLILPTQVHGTAVTAGDTIAPHANRHIARAVLNKDGESDMGSSLNK